MLQRGVMDFAGGGAVHGVGGAAALMGAYILGPRIGRFSKDENDNWISTKIPGHNLVLSALGGFLLWLGFFAFNGGSGKYRGTISEVSSFSRWTDGFLTRSLIPLPDTGYDIVGEGAVQTGRVVTVATLGGAMGAVTMLLFIKFKDGAYYGRDCSCLTNIH